MSLRSSIWLMMGGACPSYLDLNFATMANGVIPHFLGSTWDVASGVARNNPTLSPTELLTDPGLEAWTSATNLTNWTETIGGTSTVNQETSVIHGGSNACRLAVDASSTLVAIDQVLTHITGVWLLQSAWLKSSINAKNQSFRNSLFSLTPIFVMTTTYQQFYAGLRTTAANSTAGIRRSAGGSASCSLYSDDLSAKVLTLATLSSVRKFSSQYGSIKVSWTVGANAACPMGVIMCADYPTFNNFIVVYHDNVPPSASGTIRMDKCVNGTYTNLIGTTTPYVAGANVMIKRLTGTNTFQAWYGAAGAEAQIGADQTITDDSIINNKYHGLFDTSPQLNTCTRMIYNAAG